MKSLLKVFICSLNLLFGKVYTQVCISCQLPYQNHNEYRNINSSVLSTFFVILYSLCETMINYIVLMFLNKLCRDFKRKENRNYTLKYKQDRKYQIFPDFLPHFIFVYYTKRRKSFWHMECFSVCLFKFSKFCMLFRR